MTTPVQTRQPQALSDLAFWLAVRHQEEQQQIAQKTAAGLALLWGLLQFDKLDKTTPAWLHAVTLQVEPQFRASEDAAFKFVQGSKWAIEPLSDPLKKVNTVFPVRDFQLAMRATGPAGIKRASAIAFNGPEGDSGPLSPDIAPEVYQANVDALINDIMARGKLNSTGAGVAQTLNGGRGEVQQLVVIDAAERFRNRQAIGWARFTEDSDTGPCYFCALLASQGAVFYDSTSFDRSNNKIRDIVGAPEGEDQKVVADLLAKLDARAEAKGLTTAKARRAFVGEGPAKVHDHCRCSLRPVYRKEDYMDARAKNFLKQWNEREENYAKLPDRRRNDDASALNKFRSVYKRPPKYADNPAVSLAAVRENRELVARELGESSPHVRWWDRQIKALEAI